MFRLHLGRARSNRPLASTALLALFLLAGATSIGACGHGDAAATGAAHGKADRQRPEGKRPAPEAYSDGDFASPDVRNAPMGANSSAPGPQQSMATAQDLKVETGDLKKAEREALVIAQESGATVQQQNERDATPATPDAEPFYGDVVLGLSIPSDRFDGALARLRALGEVKSFTSQSTNVGQQALDVDAELQSVGQTIARLQQLQAQTSSVDTLLQVQQQLAWENTRLHELQRQQQGLEKRVETVAITVTLLGKKPQQPHRNWASAGLRSGWEALVATAKWVVTAIAWLAVWVIPVVVVLVLLRLAWKLLRGRRRVRFPSAPGSSPRPRPR